MERSVLTTTMPFAKGASSYLSKVKNKSFSIGRAVIVSLVLLTVFMAFVTRASAQVTAASLYGTVESGENMVSYEFNLSGSTTPPSSSNFTVSSSGGVTNPRIGNVYGPYGPYGSLYVWSVSVSYTGSGGSVTLNFVNSNGITPSVSNLPLTSATTIPAASPPTCKIGSPSVSSTSSGPVTFPVTYSLNNGDYEGFGNLRSSLISVNTTGTVSYSNVSVSGSNTNYTASVNGLSGNGSFTISVAGGGYEDGQASLYDKGAGPSSSVTVVNPVITQSSTFTSFSATQGTASAAQVFNLSGSSMNAGITVSPPTGFEVSTDGNTYSSSVTVGSSGTITSTPVYVRLAAADAASATAYSGNIQLTSTGASAVNIAVTGKVKAPTPTLQASGVTFSNTAQTGTTISWTPGNGASEMVFVAAGNHDGISISNNTNYTANTAYGSGSTDGAGNWYCVYNSANTANPSVNVTGLSANSNYSIIVIDYNGSTGIEQYLTSRGTGNPATFTTLQATTTVTSITSVGTGHTNATTVDYTVTFANALTSPPLTGDFTLSGTATGTINSITTTDNINYDVNVTGVSGDGNLELDMTNGSDASPTISNVPFSGQAYTIDNTPPTLSSITFASSDANGSGIAIPGDQVTLSFAVSEPVQTPLITIGNGDNTTNNLVTVSTSDNVNYTATYTVQGSDNADGSGNVPYTIGLTDLAGNTASYNEQTPGDPNIAFYTAPSSQASNVAFSNTTTTTTTINWTPGNGTNEVVFIAPTDSLSAAPALNNNTTYNASATYRAGGQDGSGSYYCVFNGATGSTGLTVDHLTPGENYTVYVLDYNGTPGSEQYITTTASGNPDTVTTLSPTIMVNGSFPALTTTTNTPSAPISFTVSGVNLTSQVQVNVPDGLEVSSDGQNYDADLTLFPNASVLASTTVYVRIAAGDGQGDYSGNISVYSQGANQVFNYINATVTPGAPATQASNLGFTGTTSTATTINWAPGGGSGEAVFVSTGSAAGPSPTLANNTTYTADANYGDSNTVDGSGNWYCVYNGVAPSSGNGTVSVTGLSAGTQYNVMVVDYNGTAGGEQYLTSAVSGNPATVTTQSNDATLSNIAVSQGALDQSFSPTTLSYTEELAYDGSPFTLTPVPNNANATVSMTFSNIYNSNAPLNGGVFMAYGTNTFNITVTAQDGVTTMAYTVTVTATRPAPTTQASNITFSGTSQTGTTINWTPGNGTSEAVFVSPGSLPISLANNTTYQANAQFGQGSTDGSGNWYCVYNGPTGSMSTVNVTGLSTGTSYNVMVVDYNGTAGQGQYLTSTASGNPAAVTTLSPTITEMGTLQVLTTTVGTPSNSTSFTVSGANLSAGILITPPTGFEVSLDNTNFSTTLTINPDGSGTVASTPVYVRLAASDGVNSYSGNIVLSSNGATSLNVAIARSTVTQPTVTAGLVSGTIIACQGTPSSSPNIQQFSVSGSNLAGNITVTAPTGFLVSLSAGSGYGTSVTLAPTGGVVVIKTVYASTSASASAGAIAGNAVVSSSEATSQNVALSATVQPLGTINSIANQTVGNGSATSAVTLTGTADYYSWTNDTPAIGIKGSGTNNVYSFTAVNTGASPVTATFTATPENIFYSYAYMDNNGTNTVSVINTATNAVIKTITVGNNPVGITASPDGRSVYTANSSSGTVSVISTATNTVTATITVGTNPQGIAISPDGTRVYVANYSLNKVTVINTATNAVITTVLLPSNPNYLIVSPDNGTVYVATANNGFSTINTSTYQATNYTSAYATQNLTITTDGSKVFMGSGTSPTLTIFNTNTKSFTYNRLSGVGGSTNGGMVVASDNNTLYIGSSSNGVLVFNVAANTLSTTIPSSSPQVYGLSLSANGKELYAAHTNYAGTVDAISTVTNSVIKTIAVGPYPYGLGNFVATVNSCSGVPATFTITANPSPSITPAGTLTALSTIAGTASASTSFSVSATWLQSGLLVTPPAGFEVSTDNTNFSSTVTLNGDNTGTLASTTVYVRLAAADLAGSYSGNIQLTSTNATTATAAASGTVSFPAPTSLASNVGFTGTTTTATTINWTPGNGSNEVVFIAAAPAYPPLAVNNTTYTANTAFGTNSWQCVFNGSGSSVNVTGLTPGAAYNVYIFDYNGTPGSEQYSDNLSTNTGAVTTLNTETITFSALSAVTYGAADFSPGATSDNSNVAITYSSDNLNVATIVNGNIHIVAAGSANITALQAGDATHAAASNVIQPLTVSPAPLTITPNSVTITYGQPIPTSFTASYNTFVNNDNTGNLTPGPTITTTATSMSAPGQYPITASGAADANYSISYLPGLLTINASADANLSGIALSTSTLSPAFSTGTTSYGVNVGNGINSIKITPTVEDATATLTINNVAAASGTATTIPLTVGNNTVTIVVTAQNGSTNTYTLIVNEARSSNNTLLTLKTSAGLAKGQVVPTTLTESVSNAIASITVTPTLVDNTATVTVNNVAVTSGTASASIPLVVGNNTITIVGTAQNGSTLTYTLTVTRAASAVNTLSGLALNSGTLSPVFAAATTSYTDNVGYGVQLTVTPTVTDPTATLTINNTAATSGTATAVPLTVGSNTITIVVTAQNGSAKTYTVAVNEAKSSNNTLLSLKTSAGLAQGQVVPTTLTESVSNAIGSITVTPTLVDNTATVTVNNVAVTSGSPSGAIALSVGANTITIVGTAQNGSTLTYTLTVTRAASAVNTLSALALNSGTLSPAFASATTSYTDNVGYGVQLTVTPTVTDPTATLTINGAAATSGTATAVPLTVGSNTISVVVTAQNGSTNTYTVAVNEARSSNNTLLSLKTSAGLAKGQVVPTTLTESVSNSITSITVTPTLVDNTATVTVNNVAVTSGSPSANIPLSIGNNTITIVGTAQNGSTLTYTLTVTRAGSSVNTLSGLALSSGTLSPVFASGTTSYTAGVGYGAQFAITPTVTDPTATLTINGTSATSGAATAVPLTVGSNTISIVVTAQNGSANTYTVTVNEAKSSNNTLLSLKTSGGFAQGQVVPTTLTESVPYATTSVTVTPTLADNTATVTVNSIAVTSGTASASIPLNIGANTITIVGTAQNGTTLTYTLTVTRQASANLSSLTLSSGTLSPAFASGSSTYSAGVGSSVGSITVTPTAIDPNATITVNGTTVASGSTSPTIALPVGNTTITIAVTAADNSNTVTYSIAVNRARSADDVLSIFRTSAGLAKGKTVPTTLTESVVNSVSSITVTPTVDDTTAMVKVNNVTVTSGTASASIPLAVGQTTITTVVTAQNGATLTYTLTVTRAMGSMNTVYQPISVDNPTGEVQLSDDGIRVHQAISPNGDGIDDFLQIDNISQYPDNNLKIMNRNGQLVYEAKGYDNATKTFDGHSNKTGQMQLPGTYFYSLDYTIDGVTKHKTGFLVLKY